METMDIVMALLRVSAGEVSLDAAIDLDLTGATGLWVYLGGLAAGVGQLLAFYRRPAGEAA